MSILNSCLLYQSWTFLDLCLATLVTISNPSPATPITTIQAPAFARCSHPWRDEGIKLIRFNLDLSLPRPGLQQKTPPCCTRIATAASEDKKTQILQPPLNKNSNSVTV